MASGCGRTTIRYLMKRADLERLVEVDQRVFKDRDNFFCADIAEEWTRIYSRSVMALFQGNAIVGYAKCLPLRPEAFLAALTGTGDLRGYLAGSNLLSDDEAKRQADHDGNRVAVGMVVHDPVRGGERYQIATPLFERIRLWFRTLRLRSLVCQTETPEEVRQVEGAGCRLVRNVCVTKDGKRIVWQYDLEDARALPATGLGRTMLEIWALGPMEHSWPLTARQINIVSLYAEGMQDKEISELLEISVATVETQWKQIKKRVREAEPHEAYHVTRAFIAARYGRPTRQP